MNNEYTTRQEQQVRYENAPVVQDVYRTSPRRPCCHKGCADCPW